MRDLGRICLALVVCLLVPTAYARGELEVNGYQTIVIPDAAGDDYGIGQALRSEAETRGFKVTSDYRSVPADDLVEACFAEWRWRTTGFGATVYMTIVDLSTQQHVLSVEQHRTAWTTVRNAVRNLARRLFDQVGYSGFEESAFRRNVDQLSPGRRVSEAADQRKREQSLALEAGSAGTSSFRDEMALVPAGPFTMGATATQQAVLLGFGWSDDWLRRIGPLADSAGPAHRVYLDAFYIDRHEVSNENYLAFVEATGRRPPRSWDMGRFSQPDQPVVTVSWFDAHGYCSWRGKRLPTEAEWEKSARGPDGLVYPWGSFWDPSRLNSAELHSQQSLGNFEAWALSRSSRVAAATKVGSYPEGASPYGVLDMAGNVWEWVADWYDADYYENSPAKNPRGPINGNARVLRGGAWDVPRVVAFSWFRETFIPPSLNNSSVVGFRCALSVD